MTAEILQEKFARLGVRLQVREASGADLVRREQPLTLDVRSDADGEFFDIRTRRGAEVELAVIDLRRRERHLLLQVRAERHRHFYLCGHDEMHWFVAALPERAGALTSVYSAMEALKPAEVLDAQRQQGIKGKDRQRRKNAAYIRQGQWFFLPAPKLTYRSTKFCSTNRSAAGSAASRTIASCYTARAAKWFTSAMCIRRDCGSRNIVTC